MQLLMGLGRTLLRAMNGIQYYYTILIFRTGAVGAFSRYIIAVKLIDVLRIGGGTILSIKAGGKFNTFDADDIDLKKLKNVAFLSTNPFQTLLML